MAGNTFGELFKVTTFGESHGAALGCIIDGCPAGLVVDEEFVQRELSRRRPGAGGAAATPRREADEAHLLSGVFEGKTTGCPIAIVIVNQNQHSSDYDALKDKVRPGHADYTYAAKWGVRDHRGGGRSSGRETAARVAAGAIAKMFLATQGVSVVAYTKEAAGVCGTRVDLDQIERNSMRAADSEAAAAMEERVRAFRLAGNSCGGVVECVVRGASAGLGEPVFDKLDAVLSHALMSIGAIKAVEFGAGFEAARTDGLTNNDFMRHGEGGSPVFETNNAGGILGGISRGDDIVFRVAVKPVPSVSLVQRTVDTSGNDCDITVEGRHDACLCPRIVPVVEAMAAIVMADMILRNRASKV